jgi:2-succinyl-5-enolpyruvyl-6-hydroxy-3-cyclohexene-1-carboxylate synthase
VTTDPAQHAFAFVGAFVDEMARAGVRHVCVAPGSRSTPLALTIAEHEELRLWMHLDERSAAFFALGISRASGMPAAVLCTSGTAAANFFPAVVEAQAAGVPLLVLTADRPPELREVGAAQTIDQNRLYGAHAKWFVEVSLPEATPPMLRHARSLAHRAVATALASPAGPVHLNFPFREPLVPARHEAPAGVAAADRGAWTGRDEGQAWVSVSRAALAPDTAAVAGVADRLRAASRPLIVCGPQYDAALAPSIARLAAQAGAPILADPLSQLRWGTHDRDAVIEAYDATLRFPNVAGALVPDFVLRFGATPTSKPLLEYLALHAAVPQVVVSDVRWPDPMLAASAMLRADAVSACEALVAALGSHEGDDEWRQRWIALDGTASRALRTFTEGLDEPFEGRALAEIVEAIPDGGTLFVSSSMPIRDLDTFGRGGARRIRVLANRGANGIDGVVSSALGAGAVSDGPLVLAIGDIALYHDMNGLLAARQYRLDATIVLLNNDGGGIFSFLPQAAHPKHFESLFGTPHGLDFEHTARLYGADYCRAETWDAFRAALRNTARGLRIVEMRTERARNVELHRLSREAVGRTLAGIDAG